MISSATKYLNPDLANPWAGSPVSESVRHRDGTAFLSSRYLNLLRLCYCRISTVTGVLPGTDQARASRAQHLKNGTKIPTLHFTSTCYLLWGSALVPLLFSFVLFYYGPTYFRFELVCRSGYHIPPPPFIYFDFI